MQLLRTKPLEHFKENSPLKRCLTASDLILLGVGGIIGAGVFVLTGVAAATKAGPAIVLSYLLAGIACAFSAFSYAELSSSVGGSGSAYGYAYAGMGEIFAWIMGWALILEYAIATATVAVGWSGYIHSIFTSVGIQLPNSLMVGPLAGGIINLPAFLIMLLMTGILCFGVHQSARFNNIIVLIKFLSIAVFIGVAALHVNHHFWIPFAPFGWTGVVQGASIIFFAYIGFDAVSTAAEEAINPQKDLPIGIIGSLLICTLIYVAVSGLLTGIAQYATLNTASPVADALLSIGSRFSAGIISAGAVAGLTTVMLVMFYGLTRVFFAMSRDGLLPSFFSKVHAKTHSPVMVIIVSGIVIASISGFMPIREIAELVNIGTLGAFLMVSLGVIVLRIRRPLMERPYKVPFYPFTPLLGMVLCFYLMLHLSSGTWWRFLFWMLFGLVIYFTYSYKNSRLNIAKKA